VLEINRQLQVEISCPAFRILVLQYQGVIRCNGRHSNNILADSDQQAGALAAFTVDLLVYPLDTLKTRFQSPDYKKIYFDASKKAINRKVLFRGLYQGVGSVILITIPSCKCLKTLTSSS